MSDETCLRKKCDVCGLVDGAKGAWANGQWMTIEDVLRTSDIFENKAYCYIYEKIIHITYIFIRRHKESGMNLCLRCRREMEQKYPSVKAIMKLCNRDIERTGQQSLFSAADFK